MSRPIGSRPSGPGLRIAHIITGLHQGGAESLLVDLVQAHGRAGHRSCVYALRSGGEHLARIAKLGVPVSSMSFDYPWQAPLALPRLTRALARAKPDIVHTWLYHADLVGGWAARAAGVRGLVWSLHNGRLAVETQTTTRGVVRACAALSGVLPDHIVSCSHTGKAWHAASGYPAGRISVIGNGFDLERFAYDEEGRHRLRREWGIREDECLIGLPARYTPAKDHANFLDALGILVRDAVPVRALLCGRDVATHPELSRALAARGLHDRCIRLGERADMPAVYSALDIVCSSSSAGEAFPMTLGEALGCGVPCVSTDAGDAALILGEAGLVVPVRQPEALARALRALVDEGRRARTLRGAQGRAHIAAHFTLERCAQRYLDVYREVLRAARAGAST